MKTKIIVLTLALISGCAMSVALQRTGITVKSSKLTSRNGSVLDESLKIRWYITCDAERTLSGMVFPIIPLPPVIPISDKPIVIGSKKVHLFLESASGIQLNKQETKVSLIINNAEYQFSNEYETYYVGEKTLWVYKYSADQTCEELKNAKLVFNLIDYDHKEIAKDKLDINYFDQVNWEWAYYGT